MNFYSSSLCPVPEVLTAIGLSSVFEFVYRTPRMAFVIVICYKVVFILTYGWFFNRNLITSLGN